MKMNWKTVSLLLAAVAISLIVIMDAYTLLRSAKPFKVPPDKRLQEVYPEAYSFKLDESEAWPCLAALNSSGEEIGAVFLSDRLPPAVRGYSGIISVLAAFDKTGQIKGALVLKHSETPAYFSMLNKAAFMNRFSGRSITDDFSDLDAVSGATITSEAIKRDLIDGARLLALERYGLKSPASQRFEQKELIEAALLTALLILATAAYVLRNRRLRQASLLASVAILGLWLNYSLNIQQISALLAFSNPAASIALLLLFAFAVIAAFTRRQIYCQMLCPYGALQKFMYALVPFRLNPSQRLILLASRLKYLILFVIICAFFAFGFKAALLVEPFGAVFEFSAPEITMAFAVAILLISGIYKRFFCRCLCPSGACLQVAAKTLPTLRRLKSKTTDTKTWSAPGGKLINGWRDLVFILLLVTALAGLIGIGIDQHLEIRWQEQGGAGEPQKFEKVGIEQIREGVYNKNLSDVKAKYWKPVEEEKDGQEE